MKIRQHGGRGGRPRRRVVKIKIKSGSESINQNIVKHYCTCIYQKGGICAECIAFWAYIKFLPFEVLPPIFSLSQVGIFELEWRGYQKV